MSEHACFWKREHDLGEQIGACTVAHVIVNYLTCVSDVLVRSVFLTSVLIVFSLPSARRGSFCKGKTKAV